MLSFAPRRADHDLDWRKVRYFMDKQTPTKPTDKPIQPPAQPAPAPRPEPQDEPIGEPTGPGRKP